MKFAYISERFSAANKSLLPPHPNGEISSIANAFHECSHGLHEINNDDLDDETLESLNKLKNLMDTTGLSDPSLGDLFIIKAELLTPDQKAELSREVEFLANWFGARSGKN